MVPTVGELPPAESRVRSVVAERSIGRCCDGAGGGSGVVSAGAWSEVAGAAGPQRSAAMLCADGMKETSDPGEPAKPGGCRATGVCGSTGSGEVTAGTSD